MPHQVRHRASAEPTTSCELLDALALPLFLLDEKHNIVHANEAAVAFLRGNPRLRISDGRLACLSAAGRNVLTTPQASPPKHSIRGNPNRRAVVALTTATGSAIPGVLISLRRGTQGRLRGEGNFMLLAILKPCDQPADVNLLMTIHGLSPAEARVAASIAAGYSPSDCAQRLGVQMSTIRRQLISVYRKTGARGQTDLVRLVSLVSLF